MLLLESKGEKFYGLIPIPSSLPTIIYLHKNKLRFILLEKIVYEYADEVFSTIK